MCNIIIEAKESYFATANFIRVSAFCINTFVLGTVTSRWSSISKPFAILSNVLKLGASQAHNLSRSNPPLHSTTSLKRRTNKTQLQHARLFVCQSTFLLGTCRKYWRSDFQRVKHRSLQQLLILGPDSPLIQEFVCRVVRFNIAILCCAFVV